MIPLIKETKIRKLNITDNNRMIFVSDIHGDIDTFLYGLKKINFNKDDYLFLIGDIYEKGNDGKNLETFEKIISMKKEFPKFYPMAGNCDEVFRFIIPKEAEDRLSYYLNIKKHSILNDIATKEQLEINTEMDLDKFKKIVFTKYSYLVEFMDNMDDVIFINDKLVLVHAGINDINNIPKNAIDVLKYDRFYELGNKQEKIMIVGHYPTRNYRNDVFCCNPIFDYDKKIFSIDGGNHVCKGGQINFVILDNINDFHFSYERFDHYPKYVIKEDIYYNSSSKKLSLNFIDNEIDILSEDLDFYLVRHKKSTIEFWVHKSLVYMDDNYKYYAYDSTNSFMSLKKGDVISIVIKAHPYSIINKDGYVGMIETKYIK